MTAWRGSYCCTAAASLRTRRPDHVVGWWFTEAPPDIVREALALVQAVAGERPNDPPPQEWLVAQAERRGGVLAGFAAPAGAASRRIRGVLQFLVGLRLVIRSRAAAADLP